MITRGTRYAHVQHVNVYTLCRQLPQRKKKGVVKKGNSKVNPCIAIFNDLFSIAGTPERNKLLDARESLGQTTNGRTDAKISQCMLTVNLYKIVAIVTESSSLETHTSRVSS